MPLSDNLMSMVTPQLLGSLSSKFGESPDAVQKGIQGGIATILESIGNKAGDTGFLQQILGLIKSPTNDPSVLSDLSGLASGNIPQPLKELASQFLSSVLGSADKQSTVSSLLGQASGLKSSSASSLLAMAAPMVMGILGKQAASESGLTASSLGSMASAELPGLSKYMPAGIGSMPTGATAPYLAPAATTAAATPSGMGGWVLPALIGLLVLGGLFWYFLKGQDPVSDTATKTTETATSAGTAVAEPAKEMWAALGEFLKRKLPDGTELNIPKLGVENKLIDFIEDTSKTAGKETWFDFDRLLFDTGKATLQPESQAQIGDVAAILKAYPKVHVRLGGYTDNVGDKAVNVSLSQARAANVEGELVKLGIDKSRLDSKGYGEEHPVSSNDTEDGRAKNRRISMRVTQK